MTARSTIDTRKLDPTAIIVFHQAYASQLSSFVGFALLTFLLSDVGEYLRDEVSYQNVSCSPYHFAKYSFRKHCSKPFLHIIPFRLGYEVLFLVECFNAPPMFRLKSSLLHLVSWVPRSIAQFLFWHVSRSCNNRYFIPLPTLHVVYMYRVVPACLHVH